MKIILYMATTANGYVASQDDETPWSDEEWESYHNIVKKVGNIIIGRRTYEMMLDGEEFSKIGNPVVATVTSDIRLKNNSQFHFVKNPREALETLENLGFNEAIVGGGGHLNASFMKQGLVDEIYLDVEPIIFGKGIPLFMPEDFEYKLQLLETKQLNSNTLQLHYSVLK